jgi:hypothetical protein
LKKNSRHLKCLAHAQDAQHKIFSKRATVLKLQTIWKPSAILKITPTISIAFEQTNRWSNQIVFYFQNEERWTFLFIFIFFFSLFFSFLFCFEFKIVQFTCDFRQNWFRFRIFFCFEKKKKKNYIFICHTKVRRLVLSGIYPKICELKCDFDVIRPQKCVYSKRNRSNGLEKMLVMVEQNC